MMYHATPTRNEAAIMQEGLRPFMPNEDGAPEEWVHLADNPGDTFVAAACHEDSEFTLFQVDVTGLELVPGADGPGTWMTRSTVESWRLSRYVASP